jgi:hypothetical protein
MNWVQKSAPGGLQRMILRVKYKSHTSATPRRGSVPLGMGRKDFGRILMLVLRIL